MCCITHAILSYCHMKLKCKRLFNFWISKEKQGFNLRNNSIKGETANDRLHS